ncbi:predicted protein [Sclerotinia sclerotiorum 1980 UF-70]|uniref:Uncharacterized protein n=1 Tax=Sclerotinia sclerotiorum (strain ATCC 18683 / 1980 / Ss-1) TaxID=665079 RepID=A7EZI1_SCLS1|nr:predicted protein [Sclerotinia sclerotiorum 1980 UF-70]EDN94873.1 predicted protein [Sclerotinia sclerotiorum 1980 UF-70]
MSCAADRNTRFTERFEFQRRKWKSISNAVLVGIKLWQSEHLAGGCEVWMELSQNSSTPEMHHFWMCGDVKP